MRRSYRSSDFGARRVADAKRGRRISVILPARNEEATVGDIVARIRADLGEVVDEVLVIDDGSTDATGKRAEEAGAVVVEAAAVLPEYPSPGKGQAMWKGVHASTGDLIVFCDADVSDFDPGFVLGLAGPLVARDDVSFVKGFYDRPFDGRDGEGGRVTELMARPLISVFFPHLADLRQPLSGEYAARREILESVPFVGGYGVDLGFLIDVTDRWGHGGLVQSDLGRRVHRNRPLSELSPQALAVLQVVLARAGVEDPETLSAARLLRPGAEPAQLPFTEMPALADVPDHRKTA